MTTTKYYTFNVKKFRRDYELSRWIGALKRVFKEWVMPTAMAFVLLDVFLALGNLLIGLD